MAVTNWKVLQPSWPTQEKTPQQPSHTNFANQNGACQSKMQACLTWLRSQSPALQLATPTPSWYRMASANTLSKKVPHSMELKVVSWLSMDRSSTLDTLWIWKVNRRAGTVNLWSVLTHNAVILNQHSQLPSILNVHSRLPFQAQRHARFSPSNTDIISIR